MCTSMRLKIVVLGAHGCCPPTLAMRTDSRNRDLFNFITNDIAADHAFVDQSISEAIIHLFASPHASLC